MTDSDLGRVAAWLMHQDPIGARFSSVLRRTLDQLYDGQHTGRYRWDQLHKTEKTHCGTLVEINLQREFQIGEGDRMDFRIEGVDVDCKYSQTNGGWMIPAEALGHVCLLLWADDELSICSMGLIRIEETLLTPGSNRDSKRTLGKTGRKRIQWMFEKTPLPLNVLLHLPREIVDRIMNLDSGQARIDEIFRVAQKTRIGRGVVATLGQQEDYMKRVRNNGGSRGRLRAEGIVILGDFEGHQRVAERLGLPIPGNGEFVSVRLAPVKKYGTGVVEVDGRFWRVADEDAPIVPAPDIRHIKK